MAYFKRNFGGWPVTEKRVFDPASRRKAFQSLDRLNHAQEHLSRTMGGEWGTPSEFTDAYQYSADAWKLIDAAKKLVHLANDAAQAAAKAVNGY